MSLRDIPTFSGYTANESIILFFEDFELYAAAKGLDAAAKLALLTASLRGPARTRYDTATRSGGAAAAGADDAARYTTRKTWLMEQFHTADMKQGLRDQLTTACQRIDESPMSFYTRIRHMIDVAGYDAAVKDQVAETTFMKGVHQELSLAIRSSPTTLDLTQKVDYAHRYWTARHPGQDIMSQVIPEKLRRTSTRQTTAPLPELEPQPKQPEVTEEQIDDLAKKFSEMTAHIADLTKQFGRRQPVQRFIADRGERRYRPPTTCYNCGEEGHFAKECRSETTRRAQPSERSRRLAAVADFGIKKIFEDSEEEEYYPVETGRRSGRPKKLATPYERPDKRKGKEKEVPRTILKRSEPEIPQDSDMELEEEARRIVQEITPPQSESSKETRLRKSKTYKYDAWTDLKARQPNITFEELMQLSPQVKQSLRSGMSEVKPGFTIREIHSAQSDEDDNEERKTSAYTTCQIEGCVVNAVIDTGAGGCLISKNLLDRLGWQIEKPTKMTFVTADGTTSVPLGKVEDVPVRFGEATIPVDAVVTEATSYDMIIGNTWLHKAKAVIDLNARKMRILHKGRKFEVPLNLERGIRPAMVEESDEDEGETYAVLDSATQGSKAETGKEELDRKVSSSILNQTVWELNEEESKYQEDNIEVPPLIKDLVSEPKKSEIPEYNEHGYRRLSQDEQGTLQEFTIKETWCPICGIRVYCAEMLCTCAEITKVHKTEELEQMYLKVHAFKDKKPKKVDAYEKTVPPEFFPIDQIYTGQNPHPFANHIGIYDIFWKTVPFIGRNHLYKTREMYNHTQPEYNKDGRRHGCYWNEVDPNDLYYVLMRAYPTFRRNQGFTWQNPTTSETAYMALTMPVKRLTNTAKLPERKTEEAAGFDFSVDQDVELKPGEVQMVSTGISLAVPRGHVGIMKVRSSLALAGITVEGGVIDADYRGEVKLIVTNRNKLITFVAYQGDRIAQMLVIQNPRVKIQEVDELDQTNRDKGGFGSTGVNSVIAKKITELDSAPKSKNDRHGYTLGIKLKEWQKQDIRRLLKKYEDVLATDFDQIRMPKLRFRHDVDTGDADPIKQRPYRTPPAYQKWVREEITKMEEAGIIRKSSSPWSSPIVIAPKKGSNPGEFAPRLCIDYRKLNAVTRKDAHPIPRIDDMLTAFGKNPNYFTSLDLFSGYYQIGMTERAIERSAFVTTEGQWEFVRMPFGLCNAPPTFQRAMHEVFKDMIGKCLMVYLDDVTIYTETFEEHVRTVEEVLGRLRMNRLFLKPKKCVFATHKMHFLGHVISKNGIHTDPDKVKAVNDYPVPTSTTELRTFLGMATYYRRFVKDFSTITVPMYQLLKKNIPYQWTDDQQEAFEIIKRKLTTAPILAQPDWTKGFLLYTDASSKGLGAILAQKNEKGNEQVICYASRGTHGAEAKYGATKLECLAVVWATAMFRYYLIGRRFKVITDHRALRWLMNMKEPDSIFARWIVKLQEYDFEVEYRKGKKHQNVDTLSRMPRSPQKSKYNHE